MDPDGVFFYLRVGGYFGPKMLSGFHEGIKRVFLCPHLVPRITALTPGSGKWIPLLPLSFPITARVNLAEPLLRRSRKAALRPDGAIRGISSTRPERERFIPFVIFPSQVAA